MKLLRLPRSQVRLGMALPWSVRDEHGQLLLSRGHLIVDQRQMDELLARGAFVDEDEARAEAAAATARKVLISGGLPANSVDRTSSLFELWDRSTDALKSAMNPQSGDADFPTRMQQFAQQLVEIFDINPNIAIYRSIRQDNVKNFYYGYTHAVLTAMLCLLISRHLRWSPQAIMSLIKASLTMNMTVFELQGQMAAQDHPLRDKQRAALEVHTTQAVALLQKNGVTDTDWLDTVAQHHERADGTGYPTGRRDISDMAATLRAADVFMAKISPRTLRPAVPPRDALTQLYRDDHGGPISTAMLKVLGVHPPGDFVRLASGELGIVVERTENARAPIVACITDKAGHPVVHTLRHDCGQSEFAIVESVSDKSLLKRLVPERLYGFVSAPATAFRN